MYNEGISKEGDLIDTGVRLGVLQKSGSWVLLGTEKIGQGREAAKQFLKDHSEVAGDILKAVRARVLEGKREGAPALAGVAVAAEAEA